MFLNLITEDSLRVAVSRHQFQDLVDARLLFSLKGFVKRRYPVFVLEHQENIRGFVLLENVINYRLKQVFSVVDPMKESLLLQY